MIQLEHNNVKSCKDSKRIIKNKKYSHLNMLFPIYGNKEQLSELLLKRNSLLLNKLNIKQTIKSNILTKNTEELLKLPFYKNIDNTSVDNTFHYLFDKMFMGIYVKIVNSKVEIFAPFANMNFVNDWSDKIEFEDNIQSIREFDNIKKQSNKSSGLRTNYNFISYDKTKWTTNNCLLGHILDPHTKKPEVSDGTRYTIFKYILDLTCSKTKVNDVEFFINKRDNPMIKRNLTEPYFDIFNDMNHPMVSNKYPKYAPILSTCGSSLFADFMLPTEDDINLATQKYFINRCDNGYVDSIIKIPWNKRIPTAIFRGTGTGCGVTVESNQRLLLSSISKQWINNSEYNNNNNIDGITYLNAGITKWNSREKKPINSKLTFIKPKQFRFQLSESITRLEQLPYKYQIYVDGHVAAYRMCWLLASNSVILKVKSKYDYQLWYFPLLKEWTHYVPIKDDLSDLAEKITWCKQNDAKCKLIAKNGVSFYNKYLKINGIVRYMNNMLNMISKNQTKNILKPIKPWTYTMFQDLSLPIVKSHRNKCAIIISYRKHPVQNREGQLQKIIPYLEKMLKSPWFKYKIYIIEQSDDDNKFNRGKLLNVGYKVALKDKCKYFIFHDVDLLADTNAIKYYQIYPDKMIHIANIWTEKYSYENFIGGIISVNNNDFKKINGFPNNYWGWGGEDDEMLRRIRINKLQVYKPTQGNITEMKHGWNNKNAIPKNEKNQLKQSHMTTWDTNGLSDLDYKILNTNKITNNAIQVTVEL
jgi:hypothetical protein